jgi:hypothetical protein
MELITQIDLGGKVEEREMRKVTKVLRRRKG